MSAFFVGPQTINATLMLVVHHEGPKSLETLNSLGRQLWILNAYALQARYEHETVEDHIEDFDGYQFQHEASADPDTMVKSAECLLYQCSEGAVPRMDLFKWLDALVQKYRHIKDTDEYDRAPWGLCEVREG